MLTDTQVLNKKLHGGFCLYFDSCHPRKTIEHYSNKVVHTQK